MQQPGGQTPASSIRSRLAFAGLTIGACVVVGVGAAYLYPHVSKPALLAASGAVLVCLRTVYEATFSRLAKRAATGEAQARQRVRQAEDKLYDALSDEAYWMSVALTGSKENDWKAADRAASAEQIAVERRDDRLTLAALWDLTHGRMDLYHQIATGQARNSFRAAQAAMAIGFALLGVFAVLAAEAKTTTAAVSAGGLGAVGAAFAAYIGKTFIRSQESAASHLRAYFDQPLELSRYLAAERLLADAKELTPEQRAAIVSSLVAAIATAGKPDDIANDAQPRSRQATG